MARNQVSRNAPAWSFRDRLHDLCGKHGVKLTWIPLPGGKVTLLAEQPHSGKITTEIHSVEGTWAKSKTGSLVSPWDVVHGLRTRLQSRSSLRT